MITMNINPSVSQPHKRIEVMKYSRVRFSSLTHADIALIKNGRHETLSFLSTGALSCCLATNVYEIGCQNQKMQTKHMESYTFLESEANLPTSQRKKN